MWGIITIIAFGVMIYVVSWANDSLFTYLGEDDFAHKPVYSYWTMTKPAICFCFGLAVIAIAVFWFCFDIWFLGITW